MTERGKRVRNITISGAAIVTAFAAVFLWIAPSAGPALNAVNHHWVTRDTLIELRRSLAGRDAGLELRLQRDSIVRDQQFNTIMGAIADLRRETLSCLKYPPACR